MVRAALVAAALALTLLAGLGKMEPTKLWFITACVAMCSTVLLMLAKGWIGKDFKTKA